MILDQLKTLAQPLSLRYGLSFFGVFGSVARGEETNESDLDIAAIFAGEDHLFDRYMGIKQELESVFQRKVDVVTLNSIQNPYFKKNIERHLKVLYG